MSETTVPAAEAAVDTTEEVVSYELAFHVLPTVAEGEVAQVEDALKSIITTASGTIGLTEPAKRFDLAYEMQKMIDGKYRRFDSTYFGWIRFTATTAVVADILAEVEAHESILRALMVRLTRQEEEHPFYLHEALEARQHVTDIDVTAEAAAAPATEEASEAPAEEATDEVAEDTTEAAAEETSEETPAEAEAETKE